MEINHISIWIFVSIILLIFLYCYCGMLYLFCQYIYPDTYIDKIKSIFIFIYDVIFNSFSTPTIKKSIAVIHNELLNNNRIIDIVIV